MDIPVSLLIAAIAGMTLLFYYFANENRNIERYYFHNHKMCYYSLQFAYLILMLSLVYNIRFVIYHYVDKVKARFGL